MAGYCSALLVVQPGTPEIVGDLDNLFRKFTTHQDCSTRVAFLYLATVPVLEVNREISFSLHRLVYVVLLQTLLVYLRFIQT